MTLHISGKVQEIETATPVPGLVVEAYDAEGLHDGLLGRARTDEQGQYEITVSHRAAPSRDARVLIKTDRGKSLKSTRGASLQADGNAIIDVALSRYQLVDAGVAVAGEIEAVPAETHASLHTFSFDLPTENDSVATAIAHDLSPRTSIIDMLASYMRSLRRSLDDHAPELVRLSKLFSLGVTPNAIQAHHHGAVLCLRLTAEQRHPSHFESVLNMLWGSTVGDASPWVGTTFMPLCDEHLRSLTGQLGQPDGRAFLGIDHFSPPGWHPGNPWSYQALSMWLRLQDAPRAERLVYGYQRSGVNSIARRSTSVWAATPRSVFTIDYRWPAMHNRPPLSWSIAELVELSPGLYLGQILAASKRRMRAYEHDRPASDHAYKHMGYFALWDSRWNDEARRSFPFLRIPRRVPLPFESHLPTDLDVSDGHSLAAGDMLATTRASARASR